jgi:ribosomal RNA-processing protein 8
MPNKKLRTKQRNKIIAQGTLGLSQKKSELVKDTLKKLIEKSQEGLKSDDDKNEENDEQQATPVESAVKISTNNKKQDVINKKSKKNKYFFIAHPDKKEKVKNLDELGGKFVLEKEIVEKLPQKTLTETTKTKETQKYTDTNKNNKSLWIIEPCTSSEDEQDKKKDLKPKKRKAKPNIDLNNVKFERVKEILEDGTVVETYKAIEEEELEEVKKPKKDEIKTTISDNEQKDEDDEKESQDDEIEDKSKQTEPLNPLMEKLNASRFRYLNEMLYKNTSNENFSYFKEDSDAFKVYHQGFEAQAQKWPINPLDEIIKSIKAKSIKLIIADFGCGTARLAQSVKNKVHSFDLVASNELVNACDMKNVPLNDKSCDIAVFCLSLMGKNITDFMFEAHRILKLK